MRGAADPSMHIYAGKIGAVSHVPLWENGSCSDRLTLPTRIHSPGLP